MEMELFIGFLFEYSINKWIGESETEIELNRIESN